MTPVTNPATPAEMAYNRAHIRTRVVVEQAFGVLKSRFRCLHKSGGSLQYSPTKCANITIACFLLHNYCVKRRVPVPVDDDEEGPLDQDDDQAHVQAGVGGRGRDVRNDLINNWFN